MLNCAVQKPQGDIRLSLASLILVLCMLMPAFLNLSHAIHGHNEQKCSSDITLHLHEAEFDCEFQKFKLTKQLYAELPNVNLFSAPFFEKRGISAYHFLSESEILPFSLRGPPYSSPAISTI